MKKLFTFLLLGCATAMSAQQVDGDFNQDWVDCKPWDSTPTSGETVVGTQPVNWTISNVRGIGGMGATQVGTKLENGQGETEPNYSVQLTNTANPYMKTQIVPAYISLGTTWATAVAKFSGVSDADGGVYGGKGFTYKPDAIKLYYTRSHGTANATERASVIAYLWRGTYTQANVPGNTSLMQAATTVDMIDRDRNILGISTAKGGTVTSTEDAECIAKVEYYIEGDQEEWTELVVPFTYSSSNTPEKLNIIIAANDYFADRSTIGVGNTICIDNVSLLYYSQLQSLSYDGTAVENFDKNTYEYSIDATYDASKLEAKADGVGATVEQSYYDKATGKLTITVKGNDWNEENLNQHVYTIQFAVTKDYKNDLSVGINGQYTAPQETPIQLIEQVDGTYSFALKNFYFMDGPIGNIQLDNLTLTDGKISATQGIAITNGDDPDVEWAGPGLTMMAGGSIPVELEATVYDNENMTAEIAIDMTKTPLNQMINVTFAPSFTLNSSTSIDEETSNLYNVEFNRSFPAGWSTICLPFATTVKALGATQAQEFTAFANNTLEFTKVSTGELAANTPYLIHFKQAKDLSAAPIYAPMTVESSTPKAVTFGNVTFTGNYTAGMSMEGYYGVADQNGSQYIMKGGSNSTLGSTSAYFSVAGAAAEVNRLALDLDGVTAIGGVETEGAEDAFDVYSISGVKVRTGATNLDGLQRGLYIVNGKKVLVK